MTQPIAGWYTDPAGDTTKLRYWDGAKWTDSLMDAPAPQPETPSSPEESQPIQPVQSAQSSQPTQPTQPGQPSASEAEPATSAPTTSAYDAAYQQPEQPIYAATPIPETTTPIYVNYADAPLYYVSPQDTTLRLVAFILALISTITMGFAVIPLAWMIPMTVMTWQIYKGKRANTVGFDVCSLIFLNLVSGILLLVSTKDQ